MNIQESHTARLLSVGRERLRAALTTATTARRFRSVSERVVTAFSKSRLAATGRAGERIARASWLYRWLTTEPDPEVVVIDLRETYVVGPILGMLDRLFSVIASGWSQARSGTLLEQVHETIEARPVRTVSLAVLAAIVTNLVLTVVRGSLTTTTVGVRLIAASLALAGTRVNASWDDVTDSWTYSLLVTLLEPPEPPDERERN